MTLTRSVPVYGQDELEYCGVSVDGMWKARWFELTSSASGMRSEPNVGDKVPFSVYPEKWKRHWSAMVDTRVA